MTISVIVMPRVAQTTTPSSLCVMPNKICSLVRRFGPSTPTSAAAAVPSSCRFPASSMRGWPPPSFVFSSYVGVRRAIVGFGVGGNLPVSLALFTEFLPTKQQATLLCYWNGLFWGAGIICASLIGLIFSNALGRG